MELRKITTPRLTTACRFHGRPDGRKLLLIHGNASSSVFYEHIMERLADKFCMAAPDLRCFGDSDALPVDATRGMRDFSDDIHELVEALGWDKFIIFGWSMGGGVAMQYAIDHSDKLDGMVLQSPLSPFGFGGTYGEDGKKLEPLGLGSGAGCANVQLIAALQSGDRAFIASVIDSIYVAPPFQIAPELKEKYIDPRRRRDVPRQLLHVCDMAFRPRGRQRHMQHHGPQLVRPQRPGGDTQQAAYPLDTRRAGPHGLRH